jgi:hypothetical protein
VLELLEQIKKEEGQRRLKEAENLTRDKEGKVGDK